MARCAMLVFLALVGCGSSSQAEIDKGEGASTAATPTSTKQWLEAQYACADGVSAIGKSRKREGCAAGIGNTFIEEFGEKLDLESRLQKDRAAALKCSKSRGVFTWTHVVL